MSYFTLVWPESPYHKIAKLAVFSSFNLCRNFDSSIIQVQLIFAEMGFYCFDRWPLMTSKLSASISVSASCVFSQHCSQRKQRYDQSSSSNWTNGLDRYALYCFWSLGRILFIYLLASSCSSGSSGSRGSTGSNGSSFEWDIISWRATPALKLSDAIMRFGLKRSRDTDQFQLTTSAIYTPSLTLSSTSLSLSLSHPLAHAHTLSHF